MTNIQQITAQDERKDSNGLTKVNDILPYFEFESMRSFVWENGDRKTYCPNYKDNPHYLLEDEDIEIYFNPTDSDENFSEYDYNIMYIVSKQNEQPVNYYLYMTKDANVYLYDYKHNIIDEDSKTTALNHLKDIISTLRIILK